MNNPQVGGVYPVKDRAGLSFRVLAFDDAEVKIIHVRAGQEFGEITIFRPYFDKVTFPEDHGPIPELIAALEAHHLGACEHDAHYMGSLLYERSEDALANAKTNAVPDSEEVAA